MVSPCARRAGDVAPYQAVHPDATWPARAHGVHGASVVGADVPGGPRARGRPRWRPRCRSVGAARRVRRALPWVRAWRACADVACVGGHGAGRGRGRRPRRPARPWASPMASRGQRRAGDVAPYHGYAHGVRVRTWRALADMARCVVGADVPGGPRARGRPRCRSVGAARRGRRALPWVCAWRACADVACVGGHGAGRGRGRRPRRPARPWASSMARPWASSGRVAWLRPYGGLDILPAQHACPVV